MNCFSTKKDGNTSQTLGLLATEERSRGVARGASHYHTGVTPTCEHFGATDSGLASVSGSLASSGTGSSDSSVIISYKDKEYNLDNRLLLKENENSTRSVGNFNRTRSLNPKNYDSRKPIHRRASSNSHKTYAIPRMRPRAHSVAGLHNTPAREVTPPEVPHTKNNTVYIQKSKRKPENVKKYYQIHEMRYTSGRLSPASSEIFIDEIYSSSVNQTYKTRPEVWRPLSSSDGIISECGEPKEQQLQAYVVWVNCQLKKKPGTRVIQDLRTDMQDGVALAHLIEILALEKLDGIYTAPSSINEMLQNVEKVIQFMVNRRIRMHHTTAKDIVEGNIKSIMRLILAVAAHFKPNSVKQAPSQHGASSLPVRVSPRSNQSMSGIAQGAAATLADARHEVANIPQRPRRPWQLTQEQQQRERLPHGSDHSDRGGLLPRGIRSRDREELEGASSGSSPRSSVTGSPRVQRRLEYPVPKSRSQDFTPGPDELRRDEEEEAAANSAIWEDLLEERNGLVDELDETKSALLKLQELLLNGEPPDGEASVTMPIEGGSPLEEVVILRSKLQQAEYLCREMREELSRAKNECMELQGAKAGIQSRLADKEKTLTQLNREVLRLGFAQQSLETEKTELGKQLVEKDRTISELKKELMHRDRQIEDLVSTLQHLQQDKENTSRTLRSQIFDLHEKLKIVGETEASLSARVSTQDRKMSFLENRITQVPQMEPASSVTSSRPSSSRSAHSDGSSEMQIVRDTLQTLRSSLTGNDPQHHAIDKLEQSIANLMDKLMLADHPAHMSDSSSPGRGKINYDSTGDIRRSPITSLQGYPVQRLEADSSTGNRLGPQSTKILYFTDRTVTPFMCTIPKRLGEVRLRDIKAIFDRQGLYRYHFKAMDPEFGTVKEEITQEDAVIPGWEGKIVAWIEEDDR